MGARIGLGYYSEDAFYLTLPVAINYLFPLRKTGAYMDAGMGITWARKDARLFHKTTPGEETHFTSFIPSVGYRLHSARNIIKRISLTPVINQFGFMPWLGASIGKRF